MITKLLSSFIAILRNKAFEKNLISRFLSIILSSTFIGRVAFKLSIQLKILSVQKGLWSQRAIEYPWVLAQIKRLKSNALILDVGCAESLLSHELIARGFRVIGLDIRDYPFKNRQMLFVKRNILDTKLPNDMFDAIIVVSTIEHIGLSAYGQLTLDDEGDVKAMKELYRILKPKGIIILTTPYIGSCPFRVNGFERNYNRQRLQKLLEDFRIVREDYFYPKKTGGKFYWERMNRESIDQESFVESGLACLVLEK
jgi:SAM-dependent methyltransferase